MALVPMAHWIWRATFGNGLMIGLPLTIIKIRQNQTRLVQPADGPMCCVVVRGISATTSFVLPFVARILRSPIWVLASDAPWTQSRKSFSLEKIYPHQRLITCEEYYFPFIYCCYFQPALPQLHRFQHLFRLIFQTRRHQ